MRLDADVDTGSSSVINGMLKRGEVFLYTRPVISLSGFGIISNILEISRANSGVLSPKIFTAPHSFSHPCGQVVQSPIVVIPKHPNKTGQLSVSLFMTVIQLCLLQTKLDYSQSQKHIILTIIAQPEAF